MTVPLDLRALSLGQWQGSPRLMGIIDLIQAFHDGSGAALDAIEAMQHIDRAEGVWLDWLGERVGIGRPAVSDPSQDTRLGFDEAGIGFDQAPFSRVGQNDDLYPMNDGLYRRMIKARGRTVLGDGTLYVFEQAVREIDPSATVTDNRDMTVDVVTADAEMLQLGDDLGALPRAAGVRVSYLSRDVFGFDQAGRGFDQGVFR